jgi:hypothetical protein
MKTAIYWDLTLCSLVDISANILEELADSIFRVEHGDTRFSKPDYIVPHPRRQQSLSSLLLNAINRALHKDEADH